MLWNETFVSSGEAPSSTILNISILCVQSAEDEGHAHESDGSDYEGHESVRILTPDEMRAGRTSLRRSPARGDNGSTFGNVSVFYYHSRVVLSIVWYLNVFLDCCICFQVAKVVMVILAGVFFFFVLTHVSKMNTEGNQEPI